MKEDSIMFRVMMDALKYEEWEQRAERDIENDKDYPFGLGDEWEVKR